MAAESVINPALQFSLQEHHAGYLLFLEDSQEVWNKPVASSLSSDSSYFSREREITQTRWNWNAGCDDE